MSVRKAPVSTEISRAGAEAALEEQTRRHQRHRQQYPPARQVPGQLDDPQAVLLFCRVDAGWRLYASRDVTEARFSQAEVNYEVNWQNTAVMKNMLVITRPTQTECLAELIRLWQARDRAAVTERKAIT